jgi:toxin-antitoxin system PIN domain toxin
VAALLDVNVLVALLVQEHQHHATAINWFSKAAAEGWATCTVTELGVIRVCAQLPGTRWLPEATADRLLMMIVTNREYVWWPSMSPSVLPEVRSAQTGKQVTDRYLLGLARRNRGQLVTFDRALAGVGRDDVTCLLPEED